jgi:hypothetical protein
MAGRWAFDGLAGVGLGRAGAEYMDTARLEDGHLHGALDAICPRCLQWIEERDFVRRTAYGPLQHEVCPAPSEALSA